MTAASVPVIVRLPAWRARLALALLLAAFAVLAGRSTYLQSMRTGFLQEKGEARYSRVPECPRRAAASSTAMARRSPSRRGEIDLGHPRGHEGEPGAAQASLPRCCSSNRASSRAGCQRRARIRLSQAADPAGNRGARGRARHPGHLPAERIPPYYPGGETMAHVIGFTGVDDAGQEGLELAQQPLRSPGPRAAGA